MTNDLDLPLLPSAEQIRRREFATVRRGYDLDQVRDYLLQIADQVETLEKAVRDKRMARQPSPGEALAAQMSTEPPPSPAPTLEPAEAPEDTYERFAKKVAAVLEAADHEAERLVSQAQAESTRILGQARSEADRVRVDAQARAEEARQSGNEALELARVEADRILGGLSDRRESLVTQMHDMQSRLLSVAKDLELAMDERDETIEAAVKQRTAPFAQIALPPDATEDAGDPVDPRYEDLWADPKGRKSIDIPDLAEIDVDFGGIEENTEKE